VVAGMDALSHDCIACVIELAFREARVGESFGAAAAFDPIAVNNAVSTSQIAKLTLGGS
jgi:hypothetical protein